MFKTTHLALAVAALAAAVPASAATFTFQDGVNGYAGTQDTELRSSAPNANQGGFDAISVDGDDGSPGLQPNHGLIRFDDLFGEAAGQIGAGQSILSATLTLNVFNPGSGFTVHDMLVDWNEATATWANLGNGIQGDDIEAGAAFASFGADNGAENVGTGTLSIDVTASLQAALSGALPGYGWALVPYLNGTNGIDFDTSEYSGMATRPMLTVEVAPVPEPESYAMLLAGLGLIGAVARRARAR